MNQRNTNLQRNDIHHKRGRVPPLSIQYDKGRYAFTRGWIANPYSEDDPGKEWQRKEWQRGFDAAYFDNLSKLKAKHGTATNIHN